MKVLFSHGKESGPWGSKIVHLAELAKECGCDIDSIDYRAIRDPDLRAQHLIDILQKEQDDTILVGSSMGAYVALVASAQVKVAGVFLLAPALYIPGFKTQEYTLDNQHLAIVHGWSDDVIPPEHSIRFARQAKCSLHLIAGDHRLKSSLATVAQIFELFLADVLGERK